jgi:PEP-CTERM motif
MLISRKFAASVALACAALMSPVAYAADISNPPSVIDVVDGGGFFGRLITGAAGGDTFADQYTFSAAGGTSVVADLFSYSGSPNNGVDITSFDLYSTGGTLIGTGTAIESDGIEQWQLSANGLAADTYYVQVSGSVRSAVPAVYSASLAVTPVPEPATYGMLLGGLALMGAIGRRRKH